MSTLSKLRRLVLRDKVSIRQAAKILHISRTTARTWLRSGQSKEPKYPPRQTNPSILDPWKDTLAQWFKSNQHRNKRERRNLIGMFHAIRAMGYPGSKGPVYDYFKYWKQEQKDAERSAAGFIPLAFAPGEAFQFDWSTEYAFLGGMKRKLEVAHIKLACSRAFLLVAYYNQAHEMLFDAHYQGFSLFGGVPHRGIYDNMKTAVDKVGHGKERTVNARFAAMTGHYLFGPEFCNPASGWEKGIVEKNVQDRRRHIWQEVDQQRWSSLEQLNQWLRNRCRESWKELHHPQWKELSIEDVWLNERGSLLPCPEPFDGYVEQPTRVTPTALIHFQKSRYSVPCEWVNKVVSLRAYPDSLLVVGPEGECVRLQRIFERYQTLYDWKHYLPLLERKPGALRNGAPFQTMPEVLQELQRQLLIHPGGDRVMVQVLSAVTEHGLEAVLVAAEMALQSGRVSADHILNLVSRLQEPVKPSSIMETTLTLDKPSEANVSRYDSLIAQEVSHVQ